ncbi:P-loop containing nucleoside triphosphate hydrolase superfamily protein [Abeliophyllum distichum]|uniref:P-loop containing nucleoside triphosphate hydrolase superfamily protein n=1 Tax=Abeliophyllum distichum TaxID=126358 RepID=A0ABD1VXX1_9LAMI
MPELQYTNGKHCIPFSVHESISVATVFSFAYKLQLAIIFIDEVDNFLGQCKSTDHEALTNMKTEVMGLWDGCTTISSLNGKPSLKLRPLSQLDLEKVISTTTKTNAAASEYSRLSSHSSGWSMNRESDDFQVQAAISELSKLVFFPNFEPSVRFSS